MEYKLNFSVIIPVYNNWDQLQLCIDALDNQSYDRDLYEIIVVDNASDENLPAEFRVPENMRIEREPRPGSYIARNRGAKTATGRYLAFTDSDCIPDKNWLKNAAHLFKTSGCDSIGGNIKIFRSESGSKHAYIYEKYHAFKQEEWAPEGNSCTANHFIKRDVFESVNGFDASLKSGGDWEFSQRCVNSGFSMQYGEDVIVLHPARINLRAILKKHFRHVCWGSVINREKYNCGQFRVLASSLKWSLKSLFEAKPSINNLHHRAVVLYIDFIKMGVQFFGHSLILLGIVDPKKVRE